MSNEATLYAKGLTVEVFDKAPQPSPPPVVDSFAAAPASVTFGQTVLLAWRTHDADSVTIDNGVGIRPPNGSVTVTPNASVTYTLTATSDGGTDTAAASIAVAPIDTSLGVIVSKSVNMAKTLMMQGYMNAPPGYDAGRYDRQQYVAILSGNSATYRCTTNNFTGGGTRVPFGVNATLTLLFDDKPVATKDVFAADTSVSFAVNLIGISEGWYKASVTGLDGTWSTLDYGVYVMKGTTALPQTRTPVVTGSYTLAFTAKHHFAWVPAQPAPIILPLVPRECPHFSEIPIRGNLVITQLVHGRAGDVYDYCVTKEGVVVTANMQRYNFFSFQQPKPYYPMHDGPRGKGTLFCPTHLEVSNAAPTAEQGNALGPIDNVYFTDSWRFGKVRESGEVITIAGWVHSSLPQYWNDPHNAELRGNWSSIPQARWGFDEMWGAAWRIPPIDLAAAPIPEVFNLKPHVSGVQVWLADQRTVMPTGTGRLCKLQFSPTNHETPPVVTEFYQGGMDQVFDVVSNGGDINNPVSDADFRLWTSNRIGHEIRVLDMNANLVEVWDNIPQPEGLFLHQRDDGWWLYYVSTIRAGGAERGAIIDYRIRRRHTVTKEDVPIVDFGRTPNLSYYINGNTLLGKIAVSSDGTFGPRGMIALATWSNSYNGYPLMFDGETGHIIYWASTASGDPPIKGMNTQPGQTYTSAPAFGNGRFVWGTACDGLFMASRALPTDTVWPASVATGEKEWHDEGFIQVYGHYGMSQALPLPWATLSANKIAFLTAHGHVKAKRWH